MPNSSVSWLDFSQKDRQKVMEVLSLFRTQDTRDELGLASIRDTFADFFFPGTSTLQTRARYFLYIPWLYTQFEKKLIPSAKIVEKLTQEETWLIQALQKSSETIGVIGQRSGKNLHRFPSSIYWFGLRAWGILRFPGSQDQYHRRLDAIYRERENLRMRRSSEGSSNEQVLVQDTWDPNLPPRPKDIWHQTNFQLTHQEAAYLQERLILSCRRSMLSFLVESGTPAEGVDFLWQHPQAGQFPEELKCWVRHAQNFSELIHGASLLYNYLLSKKRANQEWIQYYEDRLSAWRENLLQRKGELLHWDRQEFWRLVSSQSRIIPPAARHFVNQWVDGLLRNGEIADPLQRQDLSVMIERREALLKQGRSRFTSQRHLELWSGAAGAGQLEFRWNVAKRLTDDILNGLAGNGANHA